MGSYREHLNIELLNLPESQRAPVCLFLNMVDSF